MLEAVRWYFGHLPWLCQFPRSYVRVLPDIHKGGHFLTSLKAFLLYGAIRRPYASINVS